MYWMAGGRARETAADLSLVEAVALGYLLDVVQARVVEWRGGCPERLCEVLVLSDAVRRFNN